MTNHFLHASYLMNYKVHTAAILLVDSLGLYLWPWSIFNIFDNNWLCYIYSYERVNSEILTKNQTHHNIHIMKIDCTPK